MEKANALKERDAYMVAAMDKGKFAPADRKDYEAIYDANPTAARALIDKLAENKIPVDAKGHGAEANVDAVDEAYPSEWDNNLKTKAVLA